MRPLAFLVLTLVLAACAEAPSDTPDEPDTPPTDTLAATPTDTLAAPAEPLNLNTASMEDFMTIPGVGERMAHEFDEYRPYASIEQFRREIGKYVDEEQVAAYEPYVYVPIDADASDAATLAQLPGVGSAEAEALIAGRPYGSNEAFLTAYAEAVPNSDRDAAARFLSE